MSTIDLSRGHRKGMDVLSTSGRTAPGQELQRPSWTNMSLKNEWRTDA